MLYYSKSNKEEWRIQNIPATSSHSSNRIPFMVDRVGAQGYKTRVVYIGNTPTSEDGTPRNEQRPNDVMVMANAFKTTMNNMMAQLSNDHRTTLTELIGIMRLEENTRVQSAIRRGTSSASGSKVRSSLRDFPTPPVKECPYCKETRHTTETCFERIADEQRNKKFNEVSNPDKVVERRPYRMALVERQKVKEIFKELLANGIIRERNSPFPSPIILEKKKNVQDRLCVNCELMQLRTECKHCSRSLSVTSYFRSAGSPRCRKIFLLSR
ncbi:jg18667 [Pararge aegeria aegeria]|uniref:Jg18667 protein n=1 Tax=Pararge aegeria aegeria TaxID=348720 RepID=A0A8S4S557_9NEOP|nr:jg18667 [Pararge aegeria aegeria]